jgi:serine/threonine-protein kinase SRPK3
MGMDFILGVGTGLTNVLRYTRHNRNYALKILTASATQITRQGRLQELQALQAISEVVKSPTTLHCLPELVDHFETTGPHGDHICFVLHLRSTDVSAFRRSAPSRTLLLHDVKKVVLHAAYALEIVHKLGMIHTSMFSLQAFYEAIVTFDRLDVKPTSIVIVPGVEDTVAPIIEGEIELDGLMYPVMKIQPLPHTIKWDDKHPEAASHMFCLNDVATSKNLHSTITLVTVRLTSNCIGIRADWEKNYELGTPYALRSPEVILRAGYDSKIDIWAIGCLVGHKFFN